MTKTKKIFKKVIFCNKGMALITVLLLGLLGAGLVVSIYYVSKNLFTMSGMNRRYIEELEDAKSISHYIASTIMSSTRDLACGSNGTNVCIPNEVIDCNSSSRAYVYIDPSVYDSSRHQAKACYLFSVDDTTAVTPYAMHGFWIEVTNANTNERVQVEFVYKVQ